VTGGITIAGRVFSAPAATSFAQDAYLGEVLAGLGEELVGVARSSEGDPLLLELRALTSGRRVIPFLAGRLREERNGTLQKWSEAGAQELTGLLGEVEDEAVKQQLGLLAAQELARFFGSGIGGSTTSPTASIPTPEPSPAATTTSPTSVAGALSSIDSPDPIPTK
jgi:hypothetical protein